MDQLANLSQINQVSLDLEGLETYGFSIIPFFADTQLICKLREGLNTAVTKAASHHGIRNIAHFVPEVRALADSLTSGLQRLTSQKAFLVQSILFDKTTEANWNVAWHQDVTIPVNKKREVAGFGPWSIKAGIPHVQAPDSILKNMVIVRLHLDDCIEANGPLKVLPGSHVHGRLSPQEIDDQIKKTPPHLCTVPAGGLIIMRPLLLHASSRATSPSHRRVIHLQYAFDLLPDGIDWIER